MLLSTPAIAAVTVSPPQANPAAIVRGNPTSVLFTTVIGGGAPLAGGVNLLRVVVNQTVVVAQMHDDGRDGDLAADDSVFSVWLMLNEPSDATLLFRVSAAFRGQLLRVLSPAGQLSVNSPTAESMRIGLAAALDSEDSATAYLSFGERLNRLRFLDTLPSASRGALALGLRTCLIVTKTDRYELCLATFTGTDDEPHSYQFVSVQDLLGVWRIIVW